MANIKPFLDKHDFLHGLRILRRAFKSAHDQVMSELDEACREHEAHAEAIGDGPDTIYWTDSYSVITTLESLQLNVDAANAAVQELRLAFAVTFYHHWERSVCRWAGKEIKQGHPTLEKEAKKLGYPVHEDMRLVQALANLSKHGAEKWAIKLCTWPGLFRKGIDHFKVVDWRGALDLQEDHVWQIADIVEACSPIDPLSR